MEQTLKVRKSGGAKIISLPPFAVEKLGLDVGSRLTIKTVGQTIVLEPSDPEDSEEKLNALLKGVTPELMKPTKEEKAFLDSTVGKEKF